MTVAAWTYGALLAPAAFVGVRLVAAGDRPHDPRRTRAAGTWAARFGIVIATAIAVAVAVDGAASTGTLGIDGLGLSLRIDPLSAAMLLMISLLAAAIVRFSGTYLEGDERHGVFLGRLAATVACVELLVLAGNLGLLVAAWIATSLALHQLLLFYPERRGAVVAARKKFVVARIGDAFLIAGALLLYRTFGTGDLAAIFAWAPDTTGSEGLAVAAVCLAFAALLKSAQFPTHGWLVEVMETPTPVSALLHAGILNAGPFLALRMAYVLDASPAATGLLIAVGGFTAVFASVVLLTQPTVKVGLGYSSVAHMGFMLLVCGMGVYPAVLLHLVAHSFYKAHAFLSSGSVVDEVRAASVRVPARLGRPLRLAASGALALAIYLVLASVFSIDFVDQPMLGVVGAMLVLGTTQLIGPALDAAAPAAANVRVAVLAFAVTLSFFSLEAVTQHLLGDTVPHDGARTVVHAALLAVLLATAALVIGFQLTAPVAAGGPRRARLVVHLRNGLYANALLERLVAPRPEPVRVTGSGERPTLDPTPSPLVRS